MSPKSHLKSLKARFKRILSDREGRKNHAFNDSASSSSSDKKRLSSPSRFKKERSSSSSSSVTSRTKKLPPLVRTDVSSSSSASDNIEGPPSEVKRKTKKRSSSSSEFTSDNQSRIPAKSVRKLQIIGLESRFNLPLNESSQISPTSKTFASDSRLLSEKDTDQRGSRRGLWSTTLSPATSTETPSPALPRYSFSLNDSSAASSPGRVGRIKVSEEQHALQSSYDPTHALPGKSEENPEVQSKISSPKVKRNQSAFLDEERGVWRCRNCDWIYPNPKPSARHRREHKKHCGEMLNVQRWLKVIEPVEQDVQGSIEEDYEEEPLRGIVQLDTEVGKGKALLSVNQEQGGTVNKRLFDSSRAVACDDMTDQEPFDETERVKNVDDDHSEGLYGETVAEVNTRDSHDDITEVTPSEENVPEPDVESGEGDSHLVKIPDNAIVVDGLADNDAEGQETQAFPRSGHSANGDVDLVTADAEEQREVRRMEEQTKVQNAEVMEDASDRKSFTGLETSEEHESLERNDDTPTDEADDALGAEGPEELDLERLHPKADDGVIPSAESSGIVEGEQRELTLKEDENEGKIKEEIDFGTAALVARQDDVENMKDGHELEKGTGMKEKDSALGIDREITSLDSRDVSASHVEVGNHGNGSVGVSTVLKAGCEFDTINQAHFESHTDVVPKDIAGDKLTFAMDSSLRRDRSPTSLLVDARSGASSSSASSSLTSSSVGDDSDYDKSPPRKTDQDMKSPVSGFEYSYLVQQEGTTDDEDKVLSLSLGGVTAKPWRSRNALQDEMLESIIDEAASESSRRHQVDVPKPSESTELVITSTNTIDNTGQSPPESTLTRTILSHEVGTVGSAIKKEVFKNRQTFWAEITRSDVLEGGFKSPSGLTSSADQWIPAVEDAVQSSSNVGTHRSRKGSYDKEGVGTESESVRTEASTSNFDSEASTSKFHPASVASSSNADAVDEYDLERVIHEQKTHDIMCPVCGSCITKRVILRKRKRNPPPEDPKRPRLPVPLEAEPSLQSTEPEDSVGWGCLACFSIFFPKVHRGKEELDDTKESSNCLQIVFPTFPWGPKERRSAPAGPEVQEPEPRSRPTPLSPSSIHSEEGGMKREEDGCTSYLNIFNRRSALESTSPAGPGLHELDPPAMPKPLPPSSVKESWFSYLNFNSWIVSKSPRPVPPVNNKAVPHIRESEPSSTPKPSPNTLEPGEEVIKPKEEGSTSYLQIVERAPAPESRGPGQIPEKPERASASEIPPPGQIPEKVEDLKAEGSPAHGPGKKMVVELAVEDNSGTSTTERLPSSSPPHAADWEPNSPSETLEVKQFVSRVVNVPSSLPLPPPENDRCDCFEIFLPVFSWGSPELNAANDMPLVLPNPPPNDRQCLPLFWSSRKTREHLEDEDNVPQTKEERPHSEPALLGIETDSVQTPETPASPPSRECLPLITSRLSYRKPSEHQETKPVPAVVERERWRDFQPIRDISTHQLYVRQFYDQLPPTSPQHDISWRPIRPPKRRPGPPPEVNLEPSTRPGQVPVLERKPEPTIGPAQNSEGPATNRGDLVLPTLESPVQDPEGPAANCFDVILPAFPWGSPVEEPSPNSVVAEEKPRPTTPRGPPELATGLKESVKTEEPTHPREAPTEGETRHKTSKFIGHVVTEEVIVTNSRIEVIKNTTHISSLLDSNNHILTIEEIKDKPSKSTPSGSSVETQLGPSKESIDLAERVAEGVKSLNREPLRGEETETPAYQGFSRSCLPFDLPRLSWSWEDHRGGKGTRTSNMPRSDVVPHSPVSSIPVPRRRKDPYGGLIDESLQQPLLHQGEIVPQRNVASSAAVVIDSVVNIPDSISVLAPDTPGEDPEILKSLVYGGLDTTLISLGVVSSATGGDASTLTILGIGVANVAFGFLTFLGTISALYKSDELKFKQLVGPSYRVNGLLAAFAYLLFGLLLPITYGFSFRHETNRDWKMGATCLVALISIILLGWAKARVTAQKPYVVISTLVTTGFVAAIASYKVGDYVTWLLKDLGFDSV